MPNFNNYFYKEVINLYKQGWTRDKIAKHFEVPVYTINCIIEREFY